MSQVMSQVMSGISYTIDIDRHQIAGLEQLKDFTLGTPSDHHLAAVALTDLTARQYMAVYDSKVPSGVLTPKVTSLIKFKGGKPTGPASFSDTPQVM